MGDADTTYFNDVPEVDADLALQADAQIEPTTSEVPTPKPNPEVPAPVRPKIDPNAVTLRVFCTASRIKLDQLAGFQNFAIREKLGPMTMSAWFAAYQAFMQRPTK